MNEEALILIAEDDDNDALLVQDAFHRVGVLNPIKILLNTEEAIDYLLGCGQFANREDFPIPSIIFADLHSAREGGLEFVRWIKGQPSFAEIPVILMTDSGEDKDKREACEAGANLAISKFGEHEKLVEEIRLICEHMLIA